MSDPRRDFDMNEIFPDGEKSAEIEVKGDTSDWAVVVCFISVLGFIAYVLWLILG